MSKPGDYDNFAVRYQRTHEKPDKKYSIPLTLLKIAGSLRGKRVLDVGCGDGYFTELFAKQAEYVFGIDSSLAQIKLATQHCSENVSYSVSDMYTNDLPKTDLVVLPWILNYSDSVGKTGDLIGRFHDSLNENGRIIGHLDMPKTPVEHDMRKYGAIKKVPKLEDAQQMDVVLYDSEGIIETLNSFYYTRETIEQLLTQAGFIDVQWHTPVISQQGINDLGEEFWKGYVENCDLAYFSAKKQ